MSNAKDAMQKEDGNMAKNTRMYWIHALTPLHVGAGKGVGFIDLPIMREKTTNWPIVPGSAVKGVMLDHFKQNGTNEKLLDAAFGKGGDESANSGSLVLTDARLVCLPVRSLYGTFAYATSSLALERLKRDLEWTGIGDALQSPKPGEKEILHVDGSKLNDGNKVFFEDLDFTAKSDNSARGWAEFLANRIFASKNEWQSLFKERFAVLPDNSFDFLCETGTEVNARVRIKDETKIVEKGALWYEESLPIETILAGVAWCDRVFGSSETPDKIMQTFCDAPLHLQIGGKATTGKGRVRCVFSGGVKNG